MNSARDINQSQEIIVNKKYQDFNNSSRNILQQFGGNFQ